MAAALAIAVAFCSPSAQASVTVDRSCYVADSPTRGYIKYRAYGFVPNTSLTVSLLDDTKADSTESNGVLTNALDVPLPRGRRIIDRATLRVADPQRPEFSAATRVTFTRFGARVVPSRDSSVSPRLRSRYTFSGWPPGSTIYVHYRRGRRTYASRRLGRVRGRCGVLRVRKRRLEVRNPADGYWDAWFTTRRKWRPRRPNLVEDMYVVGTIGGGRRLTLRGFERVRP